MSSYEGQGAEFRDLRVNAGLTQRDLQGLSGVSRWKISMYERKRRPLDREDSDCLYEAIRKFGQKESRPPDPGPRRPGAVRKGAEFRDLRVNAGLTQRDLQGLSGVSRTIISTYECGLKELDQERKDRLYEAVRKFGQDRPHGPVRQPSDSDGMVPSVPDIEELLSGAANALLAMTEAIAVFCRAHNDCVPRSDYDRVAADAQRVKALVRQLTDEVAA